MLVDVCELPVLEDVSFFLFRRYFFICVLLQNMFVWLFVLMDVYSFVCFSTKKCLFICVLKLKNVVVLFDKGDGVNRCDDQTYNLGI